MGINTGAKSLRYGAIGALVISASLFGAVEAKAVSVSLAEIASFDILGTSVGTSVTDQNGASAGVGLPFGSVVSFLAAFDAPTLFTTAALDLGVAGLNVGSLGETFKIHVANRNEGPWDFELFLNGVATDGIAHTVAKDAIQSWSVALGGAVTSIYFQVTASAVGHAANDTGAEFDIARRAGALGAVPLPPALLLFGSGVLGLGLLARRRKQKPIVGSASLA